MLLISAQNCQCCTNEKRYFLPFFFYRTPILIWFQFVYCLYFSSHCIKSLSKFNHWLYVWNIFSYLVLFRLLILQYYSTISFIYWMHNSRVKQYPFLIFSNRGQTIRLKPLLSTVPISISPFNCPLLIRLNVIFNFITEYTLI